MTKTTVKKHTPCADRMRKMMMKKSPLLPDAEWAEDVNRTVWKHVDKTYLQIAGKLQDAGYETRFHCYEGKRREFDRLVKLMATDEGLAKKVIFAIPEVARKTPERYRRQIRKCERGMLSKLIFWGLLREAVVGIGESVYSTMYAVFRLPKTNRCIVFLAGCNGEQMLSRRRAPQGR